MNSAARLIGQEALSSRTWVVSFLFAKTQWSLLILIVAILVSSLSIIYVTNISRSLHASIQQALYESDQLHLQWGQLLLEKSTWIMQARIQQEARNKFDMIVPNNQSVVIISE